MIAVTRDFYPRPPCGGRRSHAWTAARLPPNFYPRPPCGGRPASHPMRLVSISFLSTSPLRGTTRVPYMTAKFLIFLSTSPLRGTTDRRLRLDGLPAFLSTSPLRGTTCGQDQRQEVCLISIHVPLAGDDSPLYWSVCDRSTFLSTSPLRGTTFGFPIRGAF